MIDSFNSSISSVRSRSGTLRQIVASGKSILSICLYRVPAAELASPQGYEATNWTKRTNRSTAPHRLEGRLRDCILAGAATHTNASFLRPAAELVDDVQRELEDASCWSPLFCGPLDRLRTRINAPAEGGQP
jgi:hypothetical protein